MTKIDTDSGEVFLLTDEFSWVAFREASRAHPEAVGALDIETTVEDNPWLNQPQLVSVAVSFDGHRAWVFHGDDIERARPLLEHRQWLMHNGLFDRLMLKAFWDIDCPLKNDTLAAQYLLDPDGQGRGLNRTVKPNSLEAMSDYYLQLPSYKGVDYMRILEEPWDKVAEMNGEDAMRTFNLWRPVADQLNKFKGLSRIYQWILMPAVNELIEVTLNGVPVDVPRLEEITAEFSETVSRLKDSLLETTPGPEEGLIPGTSKYPKGWPKPSSWRVNDKVDPETGEILVKGQGKYNEAHPQGVFNPASPDQVRHVLFTLWDLPELEYTKDKDGNETDKPSTNADVLLLLDTYHTEGKQQKWINDLREYRKANKVMTSYLSSWPELMDADSWLHPRYKPLHVVTGRLSSDSPNIQNVPREKRFRSIFGGVDGWTWIKADYSQIELRVAAWVSGETIMLENYRTGGDLHALTAQMVFGVEDVTEEVIPGTTARDGGKVSNFGLLYGAGPETLRYIARKNYNVFLTSAQAKEIWENWFAAYPAISEWHKRQRWELERTGEAYSPLGRVRYLPHAKIPWEVEDMRGKKVHALLEGTNHPVQSFASDLLLKSMVNVAPKVRELGGKIITEVHDEIDLLVPNDKVDEVAGIVKATMEDVSWLEKFGINLTVPVVADIETGTHWGDVKEWSAA